MSLPSVASRLLLLSIVFAACSGGSELFLPGDGEPARIELVHGKDLTGRIGEPLADSLVFKVTDSQQRPLQGVLVAFQLTAAAPGSDLVPDTAETDAAGKAYTRVVLGTTIGPQVGEARVVVPEGAQAPSTEFQVIALSEDANEMAAFSGDNQTGAVNSLLPEPLVVQVTDAFGNPISGVTIIWSAEGGGSVSATSSVTDGEGKASVQRTLGPAAGAQATLASSEGLVGSPVSFAHTATAGNASGLSLISGDNQTAQAGTRLPADLVVRLVDEIGNGVPGAAVTWVVSTGGGSVNPENGVTDDAGYASAQYTLGPAPGANRVDAVVSGVGVVNFNATATAAAPASLAIVVQPSSSAQNGQPLARQPVIQVRDAAGGNATTAGVTITAQLSGGTGELLGTRTRVTDGTGRAAFTDLAIGGAQGTRVLVFTAAGFGGATSNPIAVSPAATTTTITGDSPDPSTAGALVTVGFRVDASGVIPSGSVTVTDGVQSCTGTLSGGSGSCQLALATVGQRTLRATYNGAAGLSGSSDTEDHRVDPATSSNDPPVAEFNSRCNGLSCSFTDASRDRDGAVVAWNWNFGDGSATTSAREPTHTYRAPGRYTVTLIVTDNDGASDQVTAMVEVQAPPPANQPPTAAFTFDCDALRCSFDSDGSRDSDGRITSFSWDFGDGGTSTDRNPRHDYAAAGTYNVTLRVTDDDGAIGTITQQVTASPPDNREPDADFEVSCSDLTCTFTDRSTDPDGAIVSRVWDYGDGSAPSSEPSHTYAAPGRYLVVLTVTDNLGATDTREREARPTAPPPQNQPPNPQFSFSCNNLDCSFTDTSTDDRGIASRSWNFGDPASGENNTSSSVSPNHSFSGTGSYTVTLTVTDSDGESRSIQQMVQVTAAPPPNQAPTAADDGATTTVGSAVTIPVLNNDTDPDNDPLTVVSAGDPANGSTEISGNQVMYTPDPGFEGNDSFTYTISDGAHQTSGTVTVNVGPAPNSTPTAQIGSISCTGMNCSDYEVIPTVTDDHNARSSDQRSVAVAASPDTPAGTSTVATSRS